MSHTNRHTDLSDDDLLLAFRQSGDNEWLGRLLQRYTVLLFGVAMKYLKEEEQAQDAVQQVFLKALTHFPQGEIQNFKGWLYVLMRNHCFQLLRDKTYHVPEESIGHIPAPEHTSQNDYIQQEATLDQMNEALHELGEEQRMSVVLFYLQKLSYQQIMERTGFSFAQVKSYIQNGKRNLKLLLLKKLGQEK